MGFIGWLGENSFNLLSAVGVIGSLWFTSVSLRSETKTRRVANLLTITANHREVWKVFLNDKSLARVRDPLADTGKQSITEAERVFVTFVILQMSSVFYAMSDQLVVKVARGKEMALVLGNIGQEIQTKGKFQIRRIEINQMIRAPAGNVIQQILGQVAVRNNEANAVPLLIWTRTPRIPDRSDSATTPSVQMGKAFCRDF